MNWKIGRNRKKRIFSGTDCIESTEQFCSPARGFYTIYTFFAGKKPDFDELSFSITKGETLALVVWDIGAYVERKFDEAALIDISRVLFFFKEHGYDVIFRPVYDRNGQGMEREPKKFATVLLHLTQIGQMLHAMIEKESSSVFLFQGLLVGSWGEMHTSAYLSEEHLLKMYQSIVPYFSDKICLAVRTPAQWRMLVTEKEFLKQVYKVSLFDDAIFGSGTHLGTFGTEMRSAAGWKKSWCRMEELQFEQEICKRVYCGGEVLDGEEQTEEKVIAELRKMHVTYLNSVHDKNRLEQFKQMRLSEKYGIWCGHSLYAYIEAHLGYRFFVDEVRAGEVKGSRQKLIISIRNLGFAPFYEEAIVFVQNEEEEKRKEIQTDFDLRTLLPGQNGILEVWIPQLRGGIRLYARRKADHAPILFCNQEAGECGVLLGSFVEA